MTATAHHLRQNVNRTYKTAERNGFAFTCAEQKYSRLSGSKQASLEIVNHKVSMFWRACWPIVIIGILCLSYFQAFAAKTAIAGLLDPTGESFIPNAVYLSIGAAISIVGLIIGHRIYEGVEYDKYTGKKRYTSSFWKFMGWGAFYILFQFVLAKMSVSNLEEGETDYMPYVVLGLAVLELLIGATVVETVLAFASIFFLNILMGFPLRKMGRRSRKTNDTYRDYLTLLNAHNAQDRENPIEREGNDNIRRAIAYYSNIRLEEGNRTQPTKQSVIQEQSRDNSSDSDLQTPVEPARNVTTSEAENHLDDFIRDSTDEDLTA
jgi:hypothetical protein